MHPDVSPSILISLCNTESKETTTFIQTQLNKIQITTKTSQLLHSCTRLQTGGRTGRQRGKGRPGMEGQQMCRQHVENLHQMISLSIMVEQVMLVVKSRKSKIHGHLYSHLLLDFCDGNDGNNGNDGYDGNDGPSKVQMWKHRLRLVELKTRQLWLQRSFYL